MNVQAQAVLVAGGCPAPAGARRRPRCTRAASVTGRCAVTPSCARREPPRSTSCSCGAPRMAEVAVSNVVGRADARRARCRRASTTSRSPRAAMGATGTTVVVTADDAHGRSPVRAGCRPAAPSTDDQGDHDVRRRRPRPAPRRRPARPRRPERRRRPGRRPRRPARRRPAGTGAALRAVLQSVIGAWRHHAPTPGPPPPARPTTSGATTDHRCDHDLRPDDHLRRHDHLRRDATTGTTAPTADRRRRVRHAGRCTADRRASRDPARDDAAPPPTATGTRPPRRRPPTARQEVGEALTGR